MKETIKQILLGLLLALISVLIVLGAFIISMLEGGMK